MSINFKDLKRGDKVLVKLNPMHNWVEHDRPHLMEPFEVTVSNAIGVSDETGWVGVDVTASVLDDGRNTDGYIHIEEELDSRYYGEVVEILERAVVEEESEDEAS